MQLPSFRVLILATACVTTITACDQQPASRPKLNAVAATEIQLRMPSNPELGRLYAQTCKACHATPVTGAPLTGEVGQWQPRLQQGMDVLLQHTIEGYKGMPPLGSCGDCGEQEFVELIEFMAGVSP